MMRIDHLVWTTGDLAETERRLAERGLVASGGGSHVGHGTHNRIVPLGGGFLELLAVEDRAEAERSPIGRGVLAGGDGLRTWVVAVDDVRQHAARLGLETIVLRRGDLEMPIAGVEQSLRDGALPFFIQRSSADAIPGADGRHGGIANIEIGEPVTPLSEWLDGADLPVTETPGERGLLTATLGSGRRLRAESNTIG
jgi:hypothetical protein